MIKAKYIAAITDKPWWLAGGIPRQNCVAAYQPKGASDYAASKVNLANPGTYNAADGAAYPTWTAAAGWIFNGSTQSLNSGVIPTQTYSMIIRFSDVTSTSCVICGFYRPDFFYLSPAILSKAYYGTGNLTAASEVGVSPNLASGVLALANRDGYRNGKKEATATTAALDEAVAIFIGCGNNNGSRGLFTAAYVQAFAVYNTTLFDMQVVALTAAMNAL